MTLKTKKPDFTLVSVELDGEGEDWLNLAWETRSAGFGLTTFSEADDGSLTCDNETMSRKFVRDVLETYLQAKPRETWPAVMASYEGVEDFLAACTPQDSWD